MEEIYFAGGCFWGCEKFFSLINGVVATSVGYANGHSEQVDYEEVCQGSGHAEVVYVKYDASVLPLERLLAAYFQLVDPFSVNQQGNDRGIQYRTGIYTADKDSLKLIAAYKQQLQEQVDKTIQVEVEPLRHYILAEDYHQDYLSKNPSGYCHIGQKNFDYAKQL